MNFQTKLTNISQKNKSLVCLGLDPDLSKLPDSVSKDAAGIIEFNKEIIEHTKDLVCAYKPNCAFYEALGLKGVEALYKTIELIPSDIPVILDAKRGDIGNTSKHYAMAAFDDLKADAVTISPYMGIDSVAPFAEYADKCLFILVKTSNQSSADFQDLELDNEPLFVKVAKKIAEWDQEFPAQIAAVVGATFPEQLKMVREIIPDAPILMPGLGKQGGNAELTIKYGCGATAPNLVVNSSRGILYASSGSDFAEAARQEAKAMQDLLNSYLNN